VSERVKVELDVVRPSTPSANDYRLRKVVYFAIANAIAFVIAYGIYWGLGAIPEGRGFDRAMEHVGRALRSHMGLAALAASTPFFASLLVGQYEMRRARARRKRNEAVQRREELLREREAERQAREARLSSRS